MANTYKVHVFKTNQMKVLDIEADDDQEAREKGLDLARQADDSEFTKPENEYISMTFDRDVGPKAKFTFEYPSEKNPKFLEVELSDVRSADSILINYDFDRNGWSIQQASIFEWDTDVDEECDPDWAEVAFIPAWGRENAKAIKVPCYLTLDQIISWAEGNTLYVPSESGFDIPLLDYDVKAFIADRLKIIRTLYPGSGL